MAQTSRSADLTSGPMLQKIILFSIPLAASSIPAAAVQRCRRGGRGPLCGQHRTGRRRLQRLPHQPAGEPVRGAFAGRKRGGRPLFWRNRGVQDTVQTSVTLGLVSGVLLAVVGFFAARGLLELMSCPEDVIDLSALYLKIYFIGMPMTMLYNFSAALLRAVGDTTPPALLSGRVRHHQRGAEPCVRHASSR